MLVTFSCKAYADITMFGDVAISLLKMMGHSGTVPGAMSADNIPDALTRLRKALDEIGQQEVVDMDATDEPTVSMKHRALPLIALLEAAHKEHAHVMWDK